MVRVELRKALALRSEIRWARARGATGWTVNLVCYRDLALTQRAVVPAVLEIRHHFNRARAELSRERLVAAVDKAREQTVGIVW